MTELEERALARRWRDLADLQARNLLVESQLPLVLFVARKYRRTGVTLSELIAEGNFALLHAVDRFDPELGYRFVTYAKYWVRVFISKCVACNSGLGLPGSRAGRKARREYTRAAALVGDGIAARQVMAERLHLNPEQADAVLSFLEQRHVSFESLTSACQFMTEAPLCSSEPSPEQVVAERREAQLLRVAVREAMAGLSPRERAIVERRLMVEDDAMSTLKELGKGFGVSRERVRQLECRLKRKLAGLLRPDMDSVARCRAA